MGATEGLLVFILFILGIAVLVTFFNMSSTLKRMDESLTLIKTYAQKMALKAGAIEEPKKED